MEQFKKESYHRREIRGAVTPHFLSVNLLDRLGVIALQILKTGISIFLMEWQRNFSTLRGTFGHLEHFPQLCTGLEMPPASAEPLFDELNWNGESQLQLFKEYSLLTTEVY